MFSVKVTGDILKDVEKYIKDSEKQVQNAVNLATTGLKLDLRQQVVSAGLGKRLSNTWRSAVNPKGRSSINASGAVWSTAREIIDSNTKGSTIRGKSGKWIVIPLEAAGKIKRGKDMLKDYQAKHGRLRFIYGKNGKNSYLVAENMRARKGKRGGFARAGDRAIAKGAVASVPVFLVIPQAKMKKRLNPQAAFTKWTNNLSNYLRG
jgi:hypothetical protein